MKATTQLMVSLLVGVGLCAGGCSNDDNQSPILTPSPQDESPPLTPASIQPQLSSKGGYQVAWMPNLESDIVGYNVYVYDPDPSRTSAFRLLNVNRPIPRTSYAWPAAIDGSSAFVRISAIDQSNNESEMSPAVEVACNSGAIPVGQEPGLDDATGGSGHGSQPSEDETGKEQNQLEPQR